MNIYLLTHKNLFYQRMSNIAYVVYNFMICNKYQMKPKTWILL
jgi:hypothetical protein